MIKRYAKPLILFSTVVFAMLLISLFISSLDTAKSKKDFFFIAETGFSLLLPMVGVILLGQLIVRYLDKDPLLTKKILSDPLDILDNDKDELIKELTIKNQSLESWKLNYLNPLTSEEVSKESLEDQTKSLIDKHVMDLINQKYIPSSIEENKIKYLETNFDAQLSGVITQINNTSKNASINLVLGIGLSFFALIILYLTITYNGFSYRKALPAGYTSQYLLHITPRIALSIFMEILAFFFLRLYKNSHDQVKYYQNEKINIESKVLALQTAIMYDQDSINAVIVSLLSVERNFVLKKDETTVDLEKVKVLSTSNNDFMNSIAKVFSAIKSK